jgi:hypothetical protein
MNAAWGNPGNPGAAGCSSALAQAGVEGGGLRCEVVGTALAEGFEIGELPAQCRQLRGVLALHQRPVRFCARQPANCLCAVLSRCGSSRRILARASSSVSREQSTSVMPTKARSYSPAMSLSLPNSTSWGGRLWPAR